MTGPADDSPDQRPDPRSDTDLLAAHVGGDPEAFGVLFGRHRDRLWAVALRTTGDREDAADALQEAMVAAFRRAASYRGDALVTTWLHRIVVNACLDRLRRNKVRAAQPLPDDPGEYAGRGGEPPTATDPEAHALAAERRATVLAALAQLPPEQRSALVLVDMEGLAVEEAARVLDCPAGTVKSRCSRGRARLAGLLAASGLLDSEQVDTGPAGTKPRVAPSDRGDRITTQPIAGDEGGVPR